MNTIGSILTQTSEKLERSNLTFGHGTSTAFDEAAFIVLESLGLPPDTDLEGVWKTPLSPIQAQKIHALVNTRINLRKPASYLLNKAYLHGLPFYVDERAIIPRSFIAELLMDDDGFNPPGLPRRVSRVLDLCTGSGCLAIIAAYQFEEAHVDAVDLSPDALAVAEQNVKLHGLENCIKLYQGDLFAPLKGQTYDLIITNPPYVDAEGMKDLPPEYLHEPAMALAAGQDGLDIAHKILAEAARHLNPGGALLCEIGRCQPQLVKAYPALPFLWLDTIESEGEVFWIKREQLNS
jgi:ribosomal protein L3 glutamine methyltransferase